MVQLSVKRLPMLIKQSFGVIIKANSGDIIRIKNNSGTVVELLQPNIDIIRIK